MIPSRSSQLCLRRAGIAKAISIGFRKRKSFQSGYCKPAADHGMLVVYHSVADEMQFQLRVALGQRLQAGGELGVPMRR
jgi:hypothetical protein